MVCITPRITASTVGQQTEASTSSSTSSSSSSTSVTAVATDALASSRASTLPAPLEALTPRSPPITAAVLSASSATPLSPAASTQLVTAIFPNIPPVNFSPSSLDPFNRLYPKIPTSSMSQLPALPPSFPKVQLQGLNCPISSPPSPSSQEPKADHLAFAHLLEKTGHLKYIINIEELAPSQTKADQVLSFLRDLHNKCLKSAPKHYKLVGDNILHNANTYGLCWRVEVKPSFQPPRTYWIGAESNEDLDFPFLSDDSLPYDNLPSRDKLKEILNKKWTNVNVTLCCRYIYERLGYDHAGTEIFLDTYCDIHQSFTINSIGVIEVGDTTIPFVIEESV